MPLPAKVRAEQKHRDTVEWKKQEAALASLRAEAAIHEAKPAIHEAKPASSSRLHTLEARSASTDLPLHRRRLQHDLRKARDGESSPPDATRNESDSKETVPKTACRVFEADTEAGRLLRKLYGTKTTPAVQYPKLRFREGAGEAPCHPVWHKSASLRASDPRESSGVRRRQAKVAVPRRPARESHNAAPIERMRGRKTAASIRLTNSERAAEVEHFRPPATKPVATSTEKRRLQLSNQFKGGRALPSEGLPAPMEGHVPLSMVLSERAALKALEHRERKRKGERDRQERLRRQQEKFRLNQDFDTVCEEVAELRIALEAATGNGGRSKVGRIRCELVDAVRRMQDLDEMIQDLEE